jgi:IstB-like ATP binding protein
VIRRWSRHSRRSVPMNRSAIAFARGARTGVRMIRISAPAKTASNAAVNLLSRSRIKNANWPDLVGISPVTRTSELLDDFAMRELSMPQADDLYELITERAGRPVIFTSNRTPTDWYPLFPNPVVAESILDRIVNTAHHIAMPGRSYRPRRRPTTTDASAR